MSFNRTTDVAPAEPAARYRTVIFIDFWNFEGHLRSKLGRDHADLSWEQFSREVVRRVEQELSSHTRPVICDLEGTRVYAAPKGDRYTQKWFNSHMSLASRYHMDLKLRQKTKARCLECGAKGHQCSACEAPLIFDQEKGVDAALVTDLLWLAWQDLYDLAIVISSDSDLIAGIERVQLSGRKVVNLRFSGIGDKVAMSSWANLDFDWLFEAWQVWDVPGFMQGGLFDNAGIKDSDNRLLRGENPRALLKELQESSWFNDQPQDSNVRSTVEHLEAEAKSRRYPIPG